MSDNGVFVIILVIGTFTEMLSGHAAVIILIHIYAAIIRVVIFIIFIIGTGIAADRHVYLCFLPRWISWTMTGLRIMLIRSSTRKFPPTRPRNI